MTGAAASTESAAPEGGVDDSRIAHRSDWSVPASTVTTTVVVVVYQVDRKDFERTLQALETQSASDFELLVVDNGTDWDVRSELARRDHCRCYVGLDGNLGVTVARNVGARLARGDLLVFLDDDAVPESGFVAAHQRLHRERDVVAARGRVRPRTDTLYNRLQSHYDLGPERRPYVINIEGNTSFDRETFLDYGGYSEDLDGRAGHEGLELTYRMVADGDVDREQVVYTPEPVVYHDYAQNVRDFVHKRVERSSKVSQLERENDQLFGFARSYGNTDGDDTDLGPVDYLRVAVLEVTVRLVRLLPSTG